MACAAFFMWFYFARHGPLSLLCSLNGTQVCYLIFVQCEKEYHVGCLRAGGRCDLKVSVGKSCHLTMFWWLLFLYEAQSLQELPKDKWFCCNDCETIHCALRDLVLKGSETISSSESMNVNRKLLDKGLSPLADNEVHWHILSGKCRRLEHLPLLSKAVSIFRVSIWLRIVTLLSISIFLVCLKEQRVRDRNWWLLCVILVHLHATICA